MNNILLKVRDLTAGYYKLAIIQNIDLDVPQGSILALIGPNGSGKSTLLKSIFRETNIFNGRIYFKGTDVTSLKSSELVKLGISYVPQIQNVFTNLTVQENLELGGYIINDKQTLYERMEEVFQLFPILKEKRKKKVKTLSGGERQILAICRGLMTRPSLLMLDEPTASIAPAIITQIFKKISEIRDKGVTLILVEQNVKRVLQIADYVAVLVAGRKVFMGSAKEVTNHKELGEIFLGKKLY